MADEQVIPKKAEDAATEGTQPIPVQIQVQESPTVGAARERLVEAISREATFLADQQAGQASTGLETLARAFALVTGGTVIATPTTDRALTSASYGPHTAISTAPWILTVGAATIERELSEF